VFERCRQKSLAVPHKTQLSRGRLKLDILLALERQRCWAQAQVQEGHFVYLSCDSSPQGSLEFFVAVEDRISRKEAAELIEATAQDPTCRLFYVTRCHQQASFM